MKAPAPSDRTIHPPVFFASAFLLVLFLAFGSLWPDVAGRVFPVALDLVATYFGWIYVPAVTGFVGFTAWLLLGPWRRIRLGADNERPAYGNLSWFSMLFSAGMGIGLLFYGVAEPMTHYQKPPGGEGAAAAAADAVPLTFFHWGIHAWSIYVILGLAIAYFSFRKGLPLSIRSVLHPLLGDRISGWPGDVVDTLAVVGTLFGLATSLGLGAMQVNSGLHFLFGVPKGPTTQLILIAVITGAATLSLVSGVDKGIKRLSELNILLAGLLLLFVFTVGPTQYVLDAVITDVGRYFTYFVSRSLDLDPRGPVEWRKGWTLFYWGWWIAWAPFVGTFVARISRGRTIGEFVLGATLVPTAVTFLWIGVFGETALYLELETDASIAAAVQADVSTAIYAVLRELPLATLNSFLAALVVTVFFVTSSDSASFVVDMITSGGHPNPPIWQRVFWAVAEGAVAAVLLVAAGRSGLSALQAGVICIGAPFCIVLILTCVGLYRALRAEVAALPPE
ncbi:MAG: BCCT family transporter [Myxococcota bacterium]